MSEPQPQFSFDLESPTALRVVGKVGRTSFAVCSVPFKSEPRGNIGHQPGAIAGAPFAASWSSRGRCRRLLRAALHRFSANSPSCGVAGLAVERSSKAKGVFLELVESM